MHSDNHSEHLEQHTPSLKQNNLKAEHFLAKIIGEYSML